jgi:hypothetical protein
VTHLSTLEKCLSLYARRPGMASEMLLMDIRRSAFTTRMRLKRIVKGTKGRRDEERFRGKVSKRNEESEGKCRTIRRYNISITTQH